MDYKQAVKVIRHHYWGPDEDRYDEHDTPEGVGLLTNFRPYRGRLVDQHFHELMQAIVVVADEVGTKQLIDKEIVLSLWSICTYSKCWAVEPEGMLRRNKLITEQDIEKVKMWIFAIEQSSSLILESDEEEATHNLVISWYINYLAEYEPGDNIAFFIDPIIAYTNKIIGNSSPPEAEIIALGKIGSAALQRLQ